MEIEKNKIVNKLDEVGANRPCQRCGSTSFSIMDGYVNFPLQLNNNVEFMISLDAPTIPVILVACNKCGAITPHALGALGLIKNDEVK